MKNFFTIVNLIKFVKKNKNVIFIFTTISLISLYKFFIPRNANSNSLNLKAINVINIENDIIFGDDKAPVTIIEYADFFCYHCIDTFQKEFDKLNKEYIQTGKVRFVFRPLVISSLSLKLAQFFMCQKRTENEYINMLKLIYNIQYQVNFNNSSEHISLIEKYFKENNTDVSNFHKCLNDKDVENKIMNIRKNAIKNGINGTPYFFINGKLLTDNIFKTIDKILLNKN